MQIFEEILFFKLHTTIQQQKNTINSTYLVSVGKGRLVEGKGHENDSVSSQSHALSFHQLPPFQLPQGKLN